MPIIDSYWARCMPGTQPFLVQAHRRQRPARPPALFAFAQLGGSSRAGVMRNGLGSSDRQANEYLQKRFEEAAEVGKDQSAGFTTKGAAGGLKTSQGRLIPPNCIILAVSSRGAGKTRAAQE